MDMLLSLRFYGRLTDAIFVVYCMYCCIYENGKYILFCQLIGLPLKLLATTRALILYGIEILTEIIRKSKFVKPFVTYILTPNSFM
uniref:Uncharacterized protein n=1 Tax=Pararge aegeria TaxID=116150 RepID=S4P160_9NEOP